MRTADTRQAISKVLVIGMAVSIAVMAAGLIWFSIGDGGEREDINPMDIPSELLRGNPVALVDLGIILLIATPAMRLVAAVGGFLREGDRIYAMVALLVLMVVLVAIIMGSR